MKIKILVAAILLTLFSALAVAEPVNINTADAATLRTLDGIGTARAAAIIEDRQTNGNFNTIEDITRVSGIGQGILSSIRDQITVGGSGTSTPASTSTSTPESTSTTTSTPTSNY